MSRSVVVGALRFATALSIVAHRYSSTTLLVRPSNCIPPTQRAEIVDAHTVKLADGTTKTADKILVAVGGWPYVPKVPGGGNEHIITSNEVFFLPTAPKKVVIWGAGYIAVEMAGIFKGECVQKMCVGIFQLVRIRIYLLV